MKNIKLGRTDLNVSEVVLGGGWVGGLFIDPSYEVMEKAVAELRDVSEEGPAVGGGGPADVRCLGCVPACDLPPAVAAGAIAPPKRGARAHRSLSTSPVES